MKIVVPLMLVLYACIAIYLGAGSITRVEIQDKIQEIYNRKDELLKDTIHTKYNGSNMGRYELELVLAMEGLDNFQWLKEIGNIMAVLVASCAFGLLGGVIALCIELLFKRKKTEDLNIWTQPFLSALTGIVVVAMVYVIPSLLVKNGEEIRPYSLMFFSLFAGIYTKPFYTFLSRSFSKLLNHEE